MSISPAEILGSAGRLFASGAGLVALGPVGLGIAGAAVPGYGAWSLGTFVRDREQLGELTSDAENWAGERLCDAGDAVEDRGKQAVSTLSFGLL
ncbi:MAG TPA: hypothetical protein VNO83_18465 [Pseudonocardia sp.]|nr:hypothetical protein [Pseudonocardia sp.]